MIKMPSLKFLVISVFLLSLSSPRFTFTSAAYPKYLFHFCSEENLTTNSTYQSKLNVLLSSLPTYANNGNGFSNATAGQDPNRIYGLFQCRGDVTTSTCLECVAFASREATQRCPAQKGAVLWYDECLLRYSASDFFSIAVLRPTVMLSDTNIVLIEPDRFHRIMLSLMNESATQAANDPKRFGTRKGDSTTSQTVLYTLAQCTRDLSSSNCFGCLKEAISLLPNVSIGGRRLLPSCHCRFEIYPFYAENETPPPAHTMSPQPLVTRPEGKSLISSSIIVAIVVPPAVSVLLLVAAGYCFLTWRAREKRQKNLNRSVDISTTKGMRFAFKTIEACTNRFSIENKLGEGGFGVVYKGELPNGQMIAVKRLSVNSELSAKQFENEMKLLPKLQHRNVVRLLGYCQNEEEKILVYEFELNKSLDYILFDPEEQRRLDWTKRYRIIVGIARGILYLHRDSRLKIIHRDLKPSNILLDSDMNPKISDFGSATTVGVDQTQENTSNVVGTHGYMSPEYAMQGQFSEKSDMYSFGVLVFEIITGKKNNSFNRQTDSVGDLLSYTRKHWREKTPLELLDSTLTDSYSENEVIKCIELGLQCVEDDPNARPTMANVVSMLNSCSITPQQLAFSLDPVIMMLQSLKHILSKSYEGVLQAFIRIYNLHPRLSRLLSQGVA